MFTYLLSTLIGLSFISAALLPFIENRLGHKRAYQAALMTQMICLWMGSLLYWNFDPSQSGLQFQESYRWIKAWNIQIALGLDGLSLALVILTLWITLIALLSAQKSDYFNKGRYLAHLLCIQGFTLSCFATTDAIMFYICWEAVLIPILFNIGIWGSQQRIAASIKFFLYTFLGSTTLLTALLYLGQHTAFANFDIYHLYALPLSWKEQYLIFVAFFLAFTIKIPLWPLHTWLPDAHTQAPTEGSIFLSAVMLKLGAYGLLRFCLPIVPDAARSFAPTICVLSFIAILYAGLIALVQNDAKRLIAYSSISHMGMVVLGTFVIFLPHTSTLNQEVVALALTGASFHMIAHGLSTAGLFLVIGLLYRRFNSRNISDYQGLAALLPNLAALCLLFVLSSIGLPGTAGFIGELLIIISATHRHLGLGLLAASSLLLSAAYSLWFYGRIFWGETLNPTISEKAKFTSLEMLPLYLLAFTILWFGLCPNLLLDLIKGPSMTILQHSLHTKL